MLTRNKQKTEFFDLVDTNGNIIEKSVSKAQVKNYPELLQQIVVGCIFNTKGELLVQRRSLEKGVEPGKIDKICGYVDAGETSIQALIREAQEEAGIEIHNLKLIHTHINTYNKYRYLFIGYSEDEPHCLDTHEVEWVKFVAIDELKRKSESKEWEFVLTFFGNVDLALSSR